MRLKRLELVGFKSFVDRTVINFETGVTGVVGPNGSGKSNIVDSIRWVMGEQSAKHLRGAAMQDVIFTGSEKRDGLGMASVFLTFDNSDGRAPAEYQHYQEIEVGRRLYRSGESEYYINKTPCRLKDIVDLFLGTGTGTKAYSIVEQGQIGLIVSAKPEDRRMLIEEAAGISKFKHRRDAAQRKIEATQSNLLRLRDIVTELEKQIGSLERQVKKAEKYKIFSEELREVELACGAHQWTAWQTKLADIESRLAQCNEQEAVSAAQLSTLEGAIETGRLTLAEIERDLSQAQEKAYGLQNTIHLLEATLKHRAQEIQDTEVRGARAIQEIDELTAKRTQWLVELEVANGQKVEVDVTLAVAQEETQQLENALAEAARGLDQITDEITQCQDALMTAVKTVTAAQSRREHLEHRNTELTTQIAAIESHLQTLDAQLAEHRRAVAAQQADLVSRQQVSMQLGEEREGIGTTLVQQQEELLRLETELTEKRELLQRAESRFQSLEELARNFEGYHEGVRAVLREREQPDSLQDVIGTVAQHIETDPEYEIAVGAVLGERVQGVLVGTVQAGMQAIDYLKSTAIGRGTFIPRALRVKDTARALPADEGVMGELSQFVRAQSDFSHVVKYLLGDVVLVRDLPTALRLWDAHDLGCTYVTLTGELVDAAGAISGGTSTDQAQAMLARRRELETLRPEVARLRMEVESAEVLRKRHAERVEGLRHQLERLSQDRHHTELDVAGLRKDLDHREREMARLTAETVTQQARLVTQRQTLEDIVAQRAALEIECATATAQRDQLNVALEQHRQRELTAEQHREQVGDELARRRAILASHEERTRAVEREIERLVSATTDAKCTIERKEAEVIEGRTAVESARREIEELRAKLTSAVREAEESSRRQQEVQQRYQILSDDVRTKEADVRALRKQYEDVRAAKHEVEIEQMQQRERIGYLEREIVERYHLHLSDRAQEFLKSDFDEATSQARLIELREKIDRLGGVNTDAIAECEELRQRHSFLAEQARDLESSIEALREAIVKINRISRERFRDTFYAINERFQQLFPKLFRGGKAELILTDETNLLESGIEIVAQPPGKKLQSVTLLSGGEKALTAVAMIFAMFLVRPSPFCLLDEVDAPLDDANIDRFNDLIREMTQYAQFILITHNKRTMELADSLYGVTMEEAGVSKLVSVRLNQDAYGPQAGDTKEAAA